jgi:hypothetical protein
METAAVGRWIAAVAHLTSKLSYPGAGLVSVTQELLLKMFKNLKNIIYARCGIKYMLVIFFIKA